MHIPVNKWTVGTIVVLLSIFGGDFIEPVLKAIAVITQAHQPAL